MAISAHATAHRWFKAEARSALLFVLPSCIILATFVYWPIVQVFWFSLHNWSILQLETPFVGLGNYGTLLSDDRFWNALRNTIYYTIGTVPLTTVLSLAVALGVNERIPGNNLLRSVYFLPGICSLAVMGLVWAYLLNPQIGMFSYMLTSVGLPAIDWLQSTRWALPAITLVGIWKSVGFDMVIFLAGLQGIPVTYYEAAKIDGAGRWQRFWNVTLPLLRPTTLFVVVTSVIGSFQVFDQVYVMTRGGPLFSTETLVTYMYHQGFQIFHMGYATAISAILFIVILVISALQLRLFTYAEVD
jgi:ABC-type sugar transport system permease subunit